MAMTVTTKVNDLHVLFNSVKEVYYSTTEITSTTLGSALTVSMELPVLDDGVTFNTGEAETQEIKLTTQANWVVRTDKGDSDISFQVASIAGPVNELMMEKKKAVTSIAEAIVAGHTYKGAGYSLSPKKIKGALVMPSDDRQSVIILPNVEMYASLVAADGDNPAYFNVKVTPLENSEGMDIIILEKQA